MTKQDWRERFLKKFFIESGDIPTELIVEIEQFIEKEIEKAEKRGAYNIIDEVRIDILHDVYHRDFPSKTHINVINKLKELKE